jgi:Uma2 family endonuclease
MLNEHADRRGEAFWRGADLVMEIVSPADRQRDLVTKRREYAQAGIPEYWIVDGEQQAIIVLTLAGEIYQVHGAFGPGEQADSVLLPGFAVDVDEVFGAAQA